MAPITSTIRGLSAEDSVGPDNGLDRDSIVSCDNVVTIPKTALGRQLGYLHPHQEAALAEAILTAYDLDLSD